MKKGESRFLATTGILFLLGIIFLILGLAFGGVRQVINYANDGGNKALGFIGEIIGVDNLKINGKDYNPYSNLGFDLKDIPTEPNEIRDLGRFRADEVESLYILVSAGDIDVKRTNGDCFGLDANGNKIRYFVRKNALYITANAIDGEIYIPEGKEFKYVCMSTLAGNVDINADIIADKFELHVITGSIDISSLNVKDGQLYLEAGDINVKKMYADKISVTDSMGNISLNGDVNEELKVSGIGNIEVNLDGDKNDYNYQLNVATGTISIGDDEWSGSSISRSIDNGSTKTVIAETTVGNIEISF